MISDPNNPHAEEDLRFFILEAKKQTWIIRFLLCEKVFVYAQYMSHFGALSGSCDSIFVSI